MNRSRRRLLIQFVAGATIALTGKKFWLESEEYVPEILINNEYSWLVLNPDERLILAIITPVILQGVSNESLSGDKLVSYLKDFDLSLSVLPESKQQQFKELLSILKSMLGRFLIGGIGTSWNEVSAEKVEVMLNRWRTSSIDLLMIAYLGVKELSFASWYGNPQNWHGIGYSGPPEMKL